MTRACVASLLLLCMSGAALADRLVIESYSGARPPDVDVYLPPVRSVLEERAHVVAAAALLARTGERLPRANDAPPETVIEALQEHLKQGFRHWDEVEFAKEIEKHSDYRIVDEQKESRVVLMTLNGRPGHSVKIG